MAWTREDAAHLVRRTGFGAGARRIDETFAAGRARALAGLLDYASVDDPAWSAANPLGLEKPEEDWYEARLDLLYRLLTSRRPLEAKLAWFWHGHFTTPLGAAGPKLFRRQFATWRANASGRFGEFLSAVYKDGAMLRYLNGAGSHRDHPNENFAREVMELYTTGTGPYTERDVREAARALTGWDVSGPAEEVQYFPERHDDGVKTILGRTGEFDGEAFMGILAARPETARRTCGRLYRFFVSERINLLETDRMVRTWTTTGGNLRAVMGTLLSSAAFWDPRVRGTLVKPPLDFAAGLLRDFDVTLDADRTREMLWSVEQMGVPAFEPPNPAGYRTGLRVTGASMLLSRCQWAWRVVYDWAPDAAVDAIAADLPAPVAPTTLVTRVAAALGIPVPTANTRAALLDYLGSTAIARDRLRERKRDCAYLLACSPEYQVF